MKIPILNPIISYKKNNKDKTISLTGGTVNYLFDTRLNAVNGIYIEFLVGYELKKNMD